ncbi:hypothetical protein [Bacillus infantis]|uniref:Uncharacterized protein n=1 Tax=Bacillus infantis TaxID=324767 RepID=A0A5D4R812_9BACI|nr:hypothetical protein [Bacillus infantis]TYS46750.1 hypothetical protein FZD51_14860 [Bacillus infantis]
MKQERLNILEEIYNEAVSFGTFDAGVKYSVEDLAASGFDLYYLEDGGYIRIPDSDPEKGWEITITYKGVDAVEQNSKES